MSETATIEAPASAPAAAPSEPSAASPAAAPTPTAAAPAAAAPTPPAKWPDNWRELAVGELPETATPEQREEHDKAMKLAKRYNSPADLLKAQREAQRRISAGELKAGLSKNATPEEVAAWRRDNGIPETPDKYELGLPAGTVLGDDDKALLDDWVKEVHGVNASPEVVQKGAKALVALRDKQIQALADKDKNDMAAFEDELRPEWGTDYRQNLEGVRAMIAHAGAEVAETILNARGAGGTALANNPAVMKWLAAHAREMGFVGHTIVPAGGDIGKSIDDEIKAIEDLQRTHDGHKQYLRDVKMQNRYRELLGARERRSK